MRGKIIFSPPSALCRDTEKAGMCYEGTSSTVTVHSCSSLCLLFFFLPLTDWIVRVVSLDYSRSGCDDIMSLCFSWFLQDELQFQRFAGKRHPKSFSLRMMVLVFIFNSNIRGLNCKQHLKLLSDGKRRLLSRHHDNHSEEKPHRNWFTDLVSSSELHQLLSLANHFLCFKLQPAVMRETEIIQLNSKTGNQKLFW